MKSKTVASILRHVASKLSDEEVSATTAPTTNSASGGIDRSGSGGGGEGEVEDDVLGTTGGSEETRLRMLYEQVAWPLGKTYAHPYDAFKIALTCVPLSLRS